ncbi:MAG: sensor histidine kinase [Candidatus Goldbacteria bacterium]|nr:sensor histidine kinase [Candidatus Goldiibacteriota bacterium]
MKKPIMLFQIILILIILTAVPTGLFYYYDNLKTTQLNNLKSKLIWAENQKEMEIIKAQISKKLDEIYAQINNLSFSNITKKYSVFLNDRIIRDYSYSKKEALDAIKTQFLKLCHGKNESIVLLFKNGNVLISNNAELLKLSFKNNTNFLQVLSSEKISGNINFTTGIAEFFIPIFDVKNRLVSVLYIRENITELVQKIRNEKQSSHGYNFIINSAGKMLLNTDMAKENTENILSYPDIKAILYDDTDSGIKEAEYNNLKGLLGYKKINEQENIICIFTPYADYSFMKKRVEKYELSLFDTTFVLPAYVFIIIIFVISIFFINLIIEQINSPLKRIVKAMTKIDDESFQEILPKVRAGDYRKLIDSILILKGRISAAEEKAMKLSQMSKELEEELSKEASRYDAELSQLRDAVKIAENEKLTFEEKLLKQKEEFEKEKASIKKKLEDEKNEILKKYTDLQIEFDKLKQEINKIQTSKIPQEKENMRIQSILAMNNELKGVLSVIKTYISTVLGGEGKITDTQQQFLGVVINKSARLERLINDLTELSLLEKGDIKPVKQPVDINNIIQDILFAIQPQADVKKIDIKVNFAPTLPSVMSDKNRISNVISSLLNQAIKVSPRGAKIIIETKDTQKDVIIRITDFGMSMPQSKANLLFINFHGTESIAGPEFVNTGLRFPIIKATLNNLNGDIWVESEIGKGKTFVISLPKQLEPGITQEEQETKPKISSLSPDFVTKPVDEVKPIIQRNVTPMQDTSYKKDTSSEIPTVTELLSLDVPFIEKKTEIPGKDIDIPKDLLGKKEIKDKDKISPQQLPEELPPLPELEDDKGTI